MLQYLTHAMLFHTRCMNAGMQNNLPCRRRQLQKRMAYHSIIQIQYSCSALAVPISPKHRALIAYHNKYFKAAYDYQTAGRGDPRNQLCAGCA